MTFEQLGQANRIYDEQMRLSVCLRRCDGIVNAKRAIYVRPSDQAYCLNEIQEFELPQDISEAVMTKAIELLNERLDKLAEEFKQI